MPSTRKWFAVGKHSGWRKNMPKGKRRSLVLRAHNQNFLAAARAKQALSNVTKDKATKRAAQEDANYFFALYRQEKKNGK